MGERVVVNMEAAPPESHVVFVASAIVEVLNAGAEARTSEAVLLEALRTLRSASTPVGNTVAHCNFDMGDHAKAVFPSREE